MAITFPDHARSQQQARTPIRIPFNRPWTAGHELEYVTEALHSGHIGGDGPFTRRCQEILRSEFKYERILLTTSCTDALEMCALLIRLDPGDEVIVPSFAFVSTANAFFLHGAVPVFADVDPTTLNIDPLDIERRITERTRAIVVVHYGGVGCDMDAICALAATHRLTVIEDNAHGMGGSYRGRPLGTIGSLATLSFHETKNFTCGEGGGLVVNDGWLHDRAEIIREKGTDRSRFFRGQVDKYGWEDIGSSFLPADILAAHLLAQLEARTQIEKRRSAIWDRYFDELSEWASSGGITLPHVPSGCEQTFHVFYMLMPSLEARTRLIDHLNNNGITATFHYPPLHLSKIGRNLGYSVGDCPVTESVADRIVRLPLFTGMTIDEQQQVISAVRTFH